MRSSQKCCRRLAKPLRASAQTHIERDPMFGVGPHTWSTHTHACVWAGRSRIQAGALKKHAYIMPSSYVLVLRCVDCCGVVVGEDCGALAYAFFCTPRKVPLFLVRGSSPPLHTCGGRRKQVVHCCQHPPMPHQGMRGPAHNSELAIQPLVDPSRHILGIPEFCTLMGKVYHQVHFRDPWHFGIRAQSEKSQHRVHQALALAFSR